MSKQTSPISSSHSKQKSDNLQPQFSQRPLKNHDIHKLILQIPPRIQDSLDTNLFDSHHNHKWYYQSKQTLSHNMTFNSSQTQLGHTNAVLFKKEPDRDIQLFLPGYMRMKIRNLIQVDISTQEIQVNAVIWFSINYGKLPRLIVDYLKQSLILRFSKKNSILLKQTHESELSIKVIEDDSLSVITFTIDLPLTFHFQPYYPFEFVNIDMSIWLSPFEKINSLLTVTVQNLQVRYDDLMVEFADVYTKEEFHSVEHYFKYLKNLNEEDQIRKLIIKVNLMDLCEPSLPVPKNHGHIQLENPEDKVSQTSQKILSNTLSFLIRQKYKQLSNLLQGIDSEGDGSPIHRFNFTKQNSQNEFKTYELMKQLLELSKLMNSPNKITYEEEHLLGQYQIVSSQLRVNFSCQKYLRLKKKHQAISKICHQIKQLKKQIKQKSSKFTVQEIQRQIINKIKIKKRETQKNASGTQIKITNLSQLTMNKKQSIKKNKEIQTSTIQQKHEKYEKQMIINSVVQEMRRVLMGPKAFQFAHFQLSIYKHPFVPLAIVFFPLWIIAFINLIIYFSPRDLSNRLANIATLLISYVAYFPIFRQQIPEYRYLLLAEILAYLQILCSFLTLLHSLVGQNNPDQNFTLQTVGVIFWISFLVTVLTILAVIIAYTGHKLSIQPQYKKKGPNLSRNSALRHIIWNNFECDYAFLQRNQFVLFDKCLSFETFIQEKYPNIKLRSAPTVQIQQWKESSSHEI